MPRYSPTRLTGSEQRFVEIFGLNQARMGVVSTLNRKGSLTTRQLVEAMGVPKNTVLNHLRILEGCGAVTANHAPGEREGRDLLWTLDRSVILAELRAMAHLLDIDQDDTLAGESA